MSLDGTIDGHRKWAGRPQSSTLPGQRNQKPPRMVDKELQRIKSLAVVSGLNRTFSQEPQSILGTSPTLSAASASSLTAPTRPSTVCGLTDMRQPQHTQSSVTSSRSQRSSTSSLQFDYSQYKKQSKRRSNTMPAQQPRPRTVVLDELEKELVTMFEDAYYGRNVAPSVATQELDQDRVDNWVVSMLPSVSTHPQSQQGDIEPEEIDDEDGGRVKELEKRLNQAHQHHQQWEQNMQQMVATYLEQKEAEADKARQLSQVVVKQEHLIEQMQSHLDQLVAANANLRSCFQESSWGQTIDTTRDELTCIRTEISALTETKQSLEEAVSALRIELRASQHQVQQSLHTSRHLESECQAQRTAIEEKLETLKQQLLEKDTLLQKYRIYGDQLKGESVEMPRSSSDVSSISPPKRSSKGSETRRSSAASTTSIPKPPTRSSRRSSANTTSSKKSYIARWTGGPLPPAAPPPTDPLPPIPMEMDKQRGISNDSSSTSHPDSPTSFSSASLPKAASRPSIDSSVAISIDEEQAYREFAEQLQARLSVSKEIDELQVWQPSDFDELQKRIDSKWGDLQDDDTKRHSLATLASKDGGAFWRGMKKKLRV
ncbi:hypothetical protein BJV82DRAFT_620452 [Fennellomyces sp. T-0311]|nr:hypothetical protein BJV82DRAFT_620452 [Fennellomyces sp. T-0311]